MTSEELKRLIDEGIKEMKACEKALVESTEMVRSLTEALRVVTAQRDDALSRVAELEQNRRSIWSRIFWGP